MTKYDETGTAFSVGGNSLMDDWALRVMLEETEMTAFKSCILRQENETFSYRVHKSHHIFFTSLEHVQVFITWMFHPFFCIVVIDYFLLIAHTQILQRIYSSSDYCRDSRTVNKRNFCKHWHLTIVGFFYVLTQKSVVTYKCIKANARRITWIEFGDVLSMKRGIKSVLRGKRSTNLSSFESFESCYY